MEENKENKENKSQAIIEIMDSGQMKITGNFLIKDMKRDTEDAPGEVVLCLCRKSGNLPYCDESHKK
jgi:CDGSH-type Zn-finger protein